MKTETTVLSNFVITLLGNAFVALVLSASNAAEAVEDAELDNASKVAMCEIVLASGSNAVKQKMKGILAGRSCAELFAQNEQ